MYRVRSQFVLSLVACFCLVPAHQTFASQSHKPRKAAAIQEAPPPDPLPEAAPVPLTLQQMPAAPPQVSYDHGQLTIISQNSTLGDILRAVHDRTGAVLDVPGNATERVAGQMGPGAPRDVLAQLLNGTHFNYVILGSATDGSKVEKVILTTKPPVPADNPGQAPANVASSPQPAGGQYGFGQQPASDDDDDSPDASADQPNQPPTQAPVRTPEQLLEELQRQQQLQQQAQPQPGQPQQTQPAAPAPRDRN